MIAQIQVRRGTTAEWAAASPVVLAAGEQGYDTTLKKTKIGDGVTEWASLPWQNTLGNITSDGKVGTVADKTLMTGAGGLVVAKTMAEAISIWKFTNPNLLHNPDFRNPVNQRGVSGEVSTAGYFYDRWLLNSGAVTTNAAYLTIGAGAEIEQRIEGNLLAGAIVTVSVMVGGTVYSGTGTMPTSAGTASLTLTDWGTATLGYAAGYMYVQLSPTAASNIQAVKLELGTISTLAYDPPMEYGAELAKCQRYFYSLAHGTSTTVHLDECMASAWGALYPRLYVPVHMRIIPSVTKVGNWLTSYMPSGEGGPTVSTIAIQPGYCTESTLWLIVGLSSTPTSGAMMWIHKQNASSDLFVSADL